MTSVTRKIGTNRGKPRLWLEGTLLDQCGFKHGAAYRLEFSNGAMVFTLDPNGTRHVAGTPARPIIDVNSAKITQSLGTVATANVLFDDNDKMIIVAPAKE